jgi:hypothetical protein
MRNRKTFVALLAAAAIAAGVVSTASGDDSNSSAGNQLAGTWRVTVNRPAPLPPLTSLQVFTDDGSVVEDANEWPATRTPAYGSWQRVDGRRYANTTVFFRFNPQTGAYLGSQKINRTIQLAEDGQSISIAAHVTVLDPDGNVLATFPAAASGTRMQVEQP